ncbi:MAG: 2-amino-4-hydroxy-6-hydroxymethyldihydropteridine diphosphokinase [Acidobacteria bacterium]|nr:MAG: 2-amino-4-hydroxy-6-hydroxymethyldihydropteridine diphosphokinase [Acidobacteriota bacterium]PYR22701.1 MAG: 2-amino-4-hydroxy-6-hydroxymethyldihydropteridine diphosphokinase [Acidobacteriota bacterium]PYR51619.1 MAG: 2-amino-4-hydroxy-6-hydroxymethyldihydropteridine diphosphokinase [Acidobacteriota bacterium]
MIAAVTLGSNLGDRAAHLDFAIARLAALLDNLKASRYYDTVPVGVSGPQPIYLNAAAVGKTTLSARELLDGLLAIERERGRERPHDNAPRTLDLDLILFGDAVIVEPGLVVPHPRFRERRFVLEPLAEVAAGLRDPVTGKTADQLLLDLRAL